jgi:hypothetical protein
MPGPVPGIHVFSIAALKSWMAGTRPAMTRKKFPSPLAGEVPEQSEGG